MTAGTRGHRRGGPLSEGTIGGIRAVLELYDRRHLSLDAAIDEIVTLVHREHPRHDHPHAT
ncbi:MAG: hypothetical protein GEV07_23320 [Streptosporangiales bacterium]|nr:hypothetical protein [Streptosporangiales bacterium]